MAANKRKYIIIVGLLAIAVVYSLYYLCCVYVSNFDAIPRKVRHLERFASILMVYGIGYYSFKQYGVKWMRDIWNTIYFVLVCLLVLIGMYDWSFGPTSAQIRSVAKTVHEILISPILFMAIAIINKTLARVTA